MNSAAAVGAGVDPEVQGTWRYGAASRRQVQIFNWTMKADGTYTLDTIGSKTPGETATLQFDAGHWSLKSSSGRVDAGTFEFPDHGALLINGQAGSRIWMRHVDGATVTQPDAEPTAPGNFDPLLVGAWRSQSASSKNQIVTTRTFDPSGTYTMTSVGSGTQASETGTFTAGKGQWTQQVQTGAVNGIDTNNGIYTVIDPDTVTMRGKFGVTTAWYRAGPGHAAGDRFGRARCGGDS